VAEAYFINSFEQHPYFAGQDFQIIESDVKKYSKALNLRGQYDLLLHNGTSVAIIEIKYKAKKEDVEEVLNKVESFKKLFPQYKNYALYLGLAGLSVEKSAEEEAIKQGVGIIKQVGKNMVINDAHLKTF
jgi:outer membrane protein assembly factor BamD (BamD/ComL family)